MSDTESNLIALPIRATAPQAQGRAAQPGLIRGWLKRWSDRRALTAACTRMALTAPHLLEDIGLADAADPPLRRRQHSGPFVPTHAAKEQATFAFAAE